MRPITFSIVFALIITLSGGCSRNKEVALTVDFSGKRQFRYCIDAVVRGSIASIDTQRSFQSAAMCTLICSGDGKNRTMFHATVPYAKFSSTILGEDEINNLTQQARDVKLTCALDNATIVPDDSMDLPLIRIGEWDVFTDLIKAIPALPKTKVKKGASWDREKIIPLDTKQGKATGHLYQSFKLDSISYPANKFLIAYISWNFTYQIELHERDSLKILDRMPSRGIGQGQAAVDISNKRLEYAKASFSVPQASEGLYKISWNESISLKYVP